MEIYKLRKPIIDGAEFMYELKLDFDSLTTNDYFRAERMVKINHKKENIIVPELNKKFLAYIVAYAAKVVPENIFQLSIQDFIYVTNMATSFLLDGESDTQESLMIAEKAEADQD